MQVHTRTRAFVQYALAQCGNNLIFPLIIWVNYIISMPNVLLPPVIMNLNHISDEETIPTDPDPSTIAPTYVSE